MAPPTLPTPAVSTRHGRTASCQSGQFRLPAVASSAREARTIVRGLLGAWGADAQLTDDAVLVSCELVTNVITHTGSGQVVCRLSVEQGRLHLEVEDEMAGPTPPTAQCADLDDESGRGLMLVGALSDEWGVRRSANGPGRVVWADLAFRSHSLGGPPWLPHTPVPVRGRLAERRG